MSLRPLRIGGPGRELWYIKQIPNDRKRPRSRGIWETSSLSVVTKGEEGVKECKEGETIDRHERREMHYSRTPRERPGIGGLIRVGVDKQTPERCIRFPSLVKYYRKRSRQAWKETIDSSHIVVLGRGWNLNYVKMEFRSYACAVSCFFFSLSTPRR